MKIIKGAGNIVLRGTINAGDVFYLTEEFFVDFDLEEQELFMATSVGDAVRLRDGMVHRGQDINGPDVNVRVVQATLTWEE